MRQALQGNNFTTLNAARIRQSGFLLISLTNGDNGRIRAVIFLFSIFFEFYV